MNEPLHIRSWRHLFCRAMAHCGVFRPLRILRKRGTLRILGDRAPRARMVSMFLASLLAAPYSLLGQDSQAYRVLYEASERYYGLESLCAHFEQEIEVTLLNQTRSGRGTICQQRPNRFSMRFSEPAGDLVVVDGESLWTFYPSMDTLQVMRFSPGDYGGGFNLYAQFLDDPIGRFEAVHEGSEAVGDGTSHKITLTPRGGASGVRAAGFRSAIVWFDVDRFLITAVDIHETNESIRKLRFSQIRPDVEIPDEVFRFEPPEGARVISDPRGPGSARE